MPVQDYREVGCDECRKTCDLEFDFSMAFQPIVDLRSRTIFAQEALVRGLNNEPAGVVFQSVNETNLYRFDQSCRVKAIELAARLNMQCLLSINFMPRAIYKPELCIRTSIAAAEKYNFPVERIMFELNEAEKLDDHNHIDRILSVYQEKGFITAIDDFGAGDSGLNQLVNFQPDMIKLDMNLVRAIETDRTRQVVVKYLVKICQELNIELIAEGVETREEMLTLADLGIYLIQGYYFARPSFESIAEVPAHLYP